jgi:hypothetical protein
MKSSSEPQVTLRIRASDPTTEVFVVDGGFRKIADGVGSLKVDVDPGLYKVRFRAGTEQVDQLVDVTGEIPDVDVYGAPVEFRSVVPMHDTSTARADHSEAAARISRAAPTSFGAGSGLLLFLRDLADDPEPQPWGWVSLHRLDGSFVTSLAEGEQSPSGDFAGLHVELDPGAYRIRVDTGPVGIYEIFVHTAEEWQTQVFACVDDFWHRSDHVRRASLRDTAVLMSREGYSPNSEQVRMTELARQGLVTGRQVVRSGDLRDMLWMKYQNPMVALYGAHIMVRRGGVNHDLIDTVTRNLRRLIGHHPDVEALQLRPSAPNPPKDLAFTSPPMLRNSWELICKATLRRSRLVPHGSVTDLIANELIDSLPWLLHRVEGVEGTSPRQSEEKVSVAESERIIASLVERARTGQSKSMVQAIVEDPGAFSALEQSIAASAIGPAYRTREARAKDPALVESTQASPTRSAAAVFRNVNAPATSIARASRTLLDKLEEKM